ncbi:MAG: FAD-dependent thymidylate synthase [Candidatus Aminicenantes bacterium]|jgi:flavin-dependent thymidylate synthase
MKVFLAGYNVDSEVLEDLKKNSPPREDVTPETLSAAYARISRDHRPTNELRAAARKEVSRARRSNRNIIFKMGHHSVAEHAVFNFDIMGVSRLAIEEIEKFRLCSYTEKSQRYIKLSDDVLLPEEIKRAGMADVFLKTVKAQNALYRSLCEKLELYVFDKHRDLAEDPKRHSLLKGWAIEDARYVVSLASEGQLGLTINARNLELLVRRFASKNLTELGRLNQKIYDLVKGVAPSIILFTEASDFDARTYADIKAAASTLVDSSISSEDQPVRLVGFSADADTKLVTVLLHSSSALPYEECRKNAERLSFEGKKEIVKAAMRHMEFFDSVLREFEFVDLIFELVISATCFAQLKRHRMATLTTQNYDPDLGVTIPPSVQNIGAEKDFMEIVSRTNEVYSLLKEKIPQGADYVLTNAHRKRTLLKVNAREFYHISRLRGDTTAQWDIRRVVARMSELAGEVMPLTCLLIGGKDSYPEVYKSVFGTSPRAVPPKE